MKTLLTSIVVVMLATLVASPASATAILSDDFNDSTGDLTGNVADTGQTWGAFAVWGGISNSLITNPVYGAGSTTGAGWTPTPHPLSSAGNTVSLSTALSAGIYQLDMDVVRGGTLTGSSNNLLYLSNAGYSQNAGMSWAKGAGDTMYIRFEGLGLADPAAGFNTNLGAGVLHTTLTIDLTSKTVKYNWYKLDDPSNPTYSGSQVVGTYAGAFEPINLSIYADGQDGALRGWDNIVLQPIPEPSTLALLATGLLGLLCYAWRKRR